MIEFVPLAVIALIILSFFGVIKIDFGLDEVMYANYFGAGMSILIVIAFYVLSIYTLYVFFKSDNQKMRISYFIQPIFNIILLFYGKSSIGKVDFMDGILVGQLAVSIDISFWGWVTLIISVLLIINCICVALSGSNTSNNTNVAS